MGSKKGDIGHSPAEGFMIQLRREKVIALYLRKHTQVQIAKKLNVSQATVSLDLKAMRRLINERAAAQMVELQAEEIAVIDQVEREAWKSFGQSKKKGTHALAGGNARFLDIILDCSDRRRRILGLDNQKDTDAQGLLEFLSQGHADAESEMPERVGMIFPTTNQPQGEA